MQTDLATSIDRLADKLNIASGQFHGMMLQQAHLQIYFDLLYLILSIIGGIIAVMLFRMVLIHSKSEECDWDFDERGVKVVGGIFLGLILTLVVVSLFENGYDLITAWTNPEFWALKELLHK